VLGQDRRGVPVAIPAGHQSGSHTLVVRATGAGKTVSEAWIACRLIEDGHAAVVIDPKGDAMLREQLLPSAQRSSARFLEWTPHNDHLSASERSSPSGTTRLALRADYRHETSPLKSLSGSDRRVALSGTGASWRCSWAGRVRIEPRARQ
jgi:hypothetical protein